MKTLKAKKLNDLAVIPTYATSGCSGMDVYSTEKCQLQPHQFKAIGTGLAFEIPEGYEIQVRPRSGLAAKHGVTVLNTPGTIDSSYRGECKVILINHSDKTYDIEVGDRIAQFVIAEVCNVDIELVDELSKTDRGDGGLGSTGK